MIKKKISQHGYQESNSAQEEILNEAGEESFPASDPIAWTLGAHHNHHLDQLTSNNESLIQLLGLEHHVILTVMHVTKYVLHLVEEDKKIDASIMEQLNEFFSGFIEKFHHYHDEKILTYLKKGDACLSEYLIRDLRHEHEYGKHMFTDLKAVFAQYCKEQKKAKMELINLLKDIYDLYTNHIAKEDEYMLPAITALIDMKTQSKLALDFAEMKKVISLNQYKKLMGFANKLEKMK